ncbi:hypothetical protein [Acinetobacter bereziniae]|uniref:hypothetical protein n=1 Tax=Acinetobacter bereziniae TaxID=106648 RepID=UPI00124F2B0B|nr:hypothetical protein [Acinetobacter bereziniae]
MHSHQIKQYLGVIFVAVFVIFGIFFYFIADENIHIFLYVFLFYIIFSVFLGRKFSLSKHSHVHALVLICSYFILQCVYTASPRIQFEEFKLWHPTWEKVQHVRIIDYSAEQYRIGRSTSFAYMNVIYEYRYQQKMYTVEQPDIARQYYLWVTDQSDTLKQSSQQKFEHSINKREFEVWVNPAQPQDAFLFYSQRWFDLRGSWLAKIFFIAQYFFVFAVAIAGSMYVVGRLRKHLSGFSQALNRQPAWLRYVLISVIFIVSVMTLLFLWIGFMVLKSQYWG